MTATAPCPNNTPRWFTGHWRDWHRGHACGQDDGRPRSEAATTEIAQHEANKATGYLTDAEMRHLRARTTSGDTLLIRALDELFARRQEVAQKSALLRETLEIFSTTQKELFARRQEVAQRTAELTEAIDIFNRTWCTEHGHSPKPEQLARIEELRISAAGSAQPQQLARIEELRKEAAAAAKHSR